MAGRGFHAFPRPFVKRETYPVKLVYKATLIKSSSVIHPHFSNSVVLSISLTYYYNNTCVNLLSVYGEKIQQR